MFIIKMIIWWAIGVICIYAAVLTHIVRAELRGYNAIEFWRNFTLRFKTIETVAQFLWGCTVWPVRLYQFAKDSKYYYTKYSMR